MVNRDEKRVAAEVVRSEDVGRSARALARTVVTRTRFIEQRRVERSECGASSDGGGGQISLSCGQEAAAAAPETRARLAALPPSTLVVLHPPAASVNNSTTTTLLAKHQRPESCAISDAADD